jgi:hypothetical protein
MSGLDEKTEIESKLDRLSYNTYYNNNNTKLGFFFEIIV